MPPTRSKERGRGIGVVNAAVVLGHVAPNLGARASPCLWERGVEGCAFALWRVVCDCERLIVSVSVSECEIGLGRERLGEYAGECEARLGKERKGEEKKERCGEIKTAR